MNPNFNQLIKTLKTARLRQAEKRRSWEYVARELNLPTTSLWHSLGSLLFSRQVGYALTTLILTLALGAGVSQAAERAVPGDIFYPLKTKVKEPVERLLIPRTPAAQASFETKLVERRLNEAEQLVKEDKLDEERKVEVKINITEQAARAASKEREPENKLEDKKEDKNDRNLEAVLKEHEEVLDKLDLKPDVRKGEAGRHNKSKEKED